MMYVRECFAIFFFKTCIYLLRNSSLQFFFFFIVMFGFSVRAKLTLWNKLKSVFTSGIFWQSLFELALFLP